MFVPLVDMEDWLLYLTQENELSFLLKQFVTITDKNITLFSPKWSQWLSLLLHRKKVLVLKPQGFFCTFCP